MRYCVQRFIDIATGEPYESRGDTGTYRHLILFPNRLPRRCKASEQSMGSR